MCDAKRHEQWRRPAMGNDGSGDVSALRADSPSRRNTRPTRLRVSESEQVRQAEAAARKERRCRVSADGVVSKFAPGDRVWWHWSTTSGYGYSSRVAAVVVAVTKYRVKIAVMRKASSAEVQEHGPWVREEKSVRPDKLSRRESLVGVIDQVEVEK